MSYVRLCRHVVKVNPLAVLALYDTLCSENHTEGVVLGECLECVLNSLDGELLSGLATEAGEHLVGVMMVLVMLVAMALFVVMMLVMLVAVALLVVMVLVVLVAMTLFVVMMMLVMLVAMALLIVMMVLVMLMAMALLIVVVLVAVALFIVVMVLVMLVAVALLVVVMVLVMVVLVMLMLLLKLLKCGVESILLLHSSEDILAVELVPRSGNYSSVGVVLSDKLNGLLRLVRLGNVGMRKNDAGCVGNLVVIKLAKVLHIHLTLVNVGNRGKAVEIGVLSLNRLYRLDNVGELAYSAGLDDNSIGVEFVKNLSKRLREIAYEGTTNATGVHLGNLNACILKEAAVNTDFTKFVFYKHELFTRVSFLDKLLDKSGLTCAEEAGKNIYFRHIKFMPRGANLRK